MPSSNDSKSNGHLHFVNVFCYLQSLRSSYQSIMIELKKVEEILQNSTGGTSRLVEGSLMAELCRHLCHFVQARLELMDLYLCYHHQ